MKEIGTVLEIFSSAKDSRDTVRPVVPSLKMIRGYGIENDKFAGKEEDRAVLVIGNIAYDIANKSGIKLQYGSLGENILLDFDPNNFDIGTVLSIGELKLQITKSCTICNGLSVFGKDLPLLLKKNRGMYCKVLTSAEISKNHNVHIEEENYE